MYRPALDSRRRPMPEPIEPDDPEFPVGGRLRYTCNNGYTLIGRSSLVCLQSGLWSVDKPVCRRGKSLNINAIKLLSDLSTFRAVFEPIVDFLPLFAKYRVNMQCESKQYPLNFLHSSKKIIASCEFFLTFNT